jgi:hypothetical protein
MCLAHYTPTIKQPYKDFASGANDSSKRAKIINQPVGAYKLMAPPRPDQVRTASRPRLGAANQPIPLRAATRAGQPFFRTSARPDHQGFGLGLYIASEIARGHAGTLDVTSTSEETRFTFRMPTT